ncbi:MAG: hypothetical protein QM541_15330 [Flavobacterium sp.]|nr:hypothetical protein [Flavobacterium sp.]
MSVHKNLFLSNGKYLYGCLVLLLMAVAFVAFSVTDSDDFEAAKREILIRKIGHELLLQSGDSVSRVLPVNRMLDNNYQLSFTPLLVLLSPTALFPPAFVYETLKICVWFTSLNLPTKVKMLVKATPTSAEITCSLVLKIIEEGFTINRIV